VFPGLSVGQVDAMKSSTVTKQRAKFRLHWIQSCN